MARSYLTLTSWARNALSAHEIVELHARAASLGAYVNAVRGNQGWTVYAVSEHGSLRESVHYAKGSLFVTVHAVLDRFEQQRDIVAEDLERWTPAELVQIAVQSGMEVERA